MKKWSIFLTFFFFSLFFCTLKYVNIIRISNISFFRFCQENGKLDWPKCARTVQHYWGHRRHKPSLNMCEMLYEHTTKTCTVKHLYQEFLFRRVTRHALPECHLPSCWQIENIYKLNFDSAVMQNLVSGTVTPSSI